MPANLPDFIVNKIFVIGSLERLGSGFTFILNNTFAPVVIYGISIQSDGENIGRDKISISSADQDSFTCDKISIENPFPFSINIPCLVSIENFPVPQKNITLFVDSRDAGNTILSVNLNARNHSFFPGFKFALPDLFKPALSAQVKIYSEQILGEFYPFIYGHFIEHLERCIYGGIFSPDGSEIRQDVIDLIKPLNVPILRYPGGNFASGYQWEDGVGKLSQRVERFDHAWNASESNRVGTDEYLDLIHKIGPEPFLVVNDGSGTPEEAARWVDYCNGKSGDQAERRAENGHPDPYNVKIGG